MKSYIGIKLVFAKPLTKQEYHDFRGWHLSEHENGDDPGYLVEYADGGEPNTPQYEGYVNWLHKEVFEDAYQEFTQLSFSHALELIKERYKVARQGWNGKDMYIFLVNGSTFEVNRPPLLGIYPEGTIINYLDHIDMRTADGSIVPWLASQTDLLADDWTVII